MYRNTLTHRWKKNDVRSAQSLRTNRLPYSTSEISPCSNWSCAAMRLSMSAMATTPTVLWNIDPKTLALSPALPVKEEFIPNGFRLPHSPPHAKMLIARIFKTEVGWKAGTCLFLPYVDSDKIFDRLQREWLRLYRISHRLYWEDLLCYRSELLYRSCVSWCHTHKKDQIKHITYGVFK